MTDQSSQEAANRPRHLASEANTFLKSEPFWLSTAFIAGLCVIFATLVAVLIALFSLRGQPLTERVDVIYKLALIGVGIVTFCTVVWRGLITTRQADAQLHATILQREQIDKLALQIAATEENTLADLLQRGAQLIAESAKKAHMAAGVAILQSVAEAPNAKFAIQAMNLLADFVQDNYKLGISDVIAEGAISSLKAGAFLERNSTRVLKFDARPIKATSNDGTWRIISGVKAVRYLGGAIDYVESSELSRKTRYFFTETRIENSNLNLKKSTFNKCVFDSCEILVATGLSIKRNTFEDCDFSGAVIDNPTGFVDLRSGGNFYNIGEEPKTKMRPPKWPEVLNPRDLSLEFDDLDEVGGQ
ncbi:MAG: hypothetical protein ACTHOP_14250 [Mesorhizobium sp.]